MHVLQIAISLTLIFASSEGLAQSTYEAVLKGKSCSEQTSQQIDCDYKIGNDFWLSIAAVGQPIATIHFMKSDYNGMYYGSYGGLHGCAMVHRGRLSQPSDPLDIAYVSKKNGKVYQDWSSCQASE